MAATVCWIGGAGMLGKRGPQWGLFEADALAELPLR